jgi:thymidylate synthase (FAD)
MTKILDHGEVRLLNQMGNDLTIVAAARVSNGVEYEEASKGAEKDQKLINYLVKHRHGTPFEHVVFQWYVDAPIFVIREWQRHRIASYNEVSGRYVKFEPKFYVPERVRVPAPTNKQGSVFLDELPYPEFEFHMHKRIFNASEYAFRRYQEMVRDGVAKEQARIILPLNTYSQFYFTVNARSLMNFLSLRAAEDAQWEIRQYAITIKEIFKDALPLTYNAWASNQFIAP